jgi:predicted cytidylate kinase
MNKQIVLVIGGPGKSGCTTIAKRLAEYLGIERVYGGEFFREAAQRKGFDSLEDFLATMDSDKVMELDREVDEKLRRYALKGDVVIESKTFAAISKKEDINCSAKIWLDASLDTRVKRALEKEDISNPISKIFSRGRIKSDLLRRYEMDKKRYKELYDIDYDHPEKYNDLVIDNSDQTPDQTFNLIINFLKDAGIKKNRE